MDVPPGDLAEEVKHLQRCINDLVSVLALPAMWSGAEPSRILHNLLDVLLGMLQLDLVYVRLKDPGGQAPIEMVRFAQAQEQITAQSRACKPMNFENLSHFSSTYCPPSVEAITRFIRMNVRS